MSFVNISRESSLKLTVEFPSHKSQHNICQGPVTVVTFGQTLTIDTTHQPVRIDLLTNRSIIDFQSPQASGPAIWSGINDPQIASAIGGSTYFNRFSEWLRHLNMPLAHPIRGNKRVSRCSLATAKLR